MASDTQSPTQACGAGAHAAEDLLPLVYEDLRQLAVARMANEPSDLTLQATALVHESYLRLVESNSESRWDSRGHFFAAAAEAMRRILIEAARARATLKRGAKHQRFELDSHAAAVSQSPDMWLDLDEALCRLERDDEQAAQLVKLRLFAGLSVTEAGDLVGLSRRTAYRTWDFARAWFSTQNTEGVTARAT